ncbi:hypothetical protein ACETU7_32860 [Rhodococcus sp. 3Y1]
MTASSDQVSVQIAAPVDGEEPGNGTGSLGSLGNIFGSSRRHLVMPRPRSAVGHHHFAHFEKEKLCL